MANATKTPNTSEEQDAAYNPGDAGYDEVFNQRAKQEELADLEASMATPFQGKNGKHIDQHGDTVKNNYNADDPAPDDAIKDAKQQESAGSLYKKVDDEKSTGKSTFSGKLKGFGGKKLVPTGGVVGLLLFALVGVGGGSVTIASSLLINIKEIFHNDRSDGTRTNRITSRAFFANKFNSQDSCKDKIPIKCKISSVSKEQIKKYQEEGFKIEGTEIGPDGNETGKKIQDDDGIGGKDAANQPDDGTRGRIEKVIYPNGTETTNPKDFYAEQDKNIESRRVAERGFSTKSSFYLNKYFAGVLSKFKFSKGQKPFPGDNEEDAKKKQAAAFNEQTGGASEEDVKNGKLNGKAEELANEGEGHAKPDSSKRVKGGSIGAILQAACSIYQLGRATEAAVKTYHAIQLARFGLMFLQAADEIKRGNGDGPKVTYLSDNLTYYDSQKEVDGQPNPKYNLSATDSEGYKIAAMGDVSGLKDFSKKYMLGGSIGESLNNILSPVETVANVFPVGGSNGRQKMKSFCRAANGDLAVAAACAGGIAALTTLGTAVPGVGNAIGATASAIGCACAAGERLTPDIINRLANIALKGIIGTNCDEIAKSLQGLAQVAISAAKSQFVKDKVAAILASLNVGSDTKGVDAGNAIAAGVGFALSKSSIGYGLRPSRSNNKNQDVSTYITQTQPLQDKYIELAKDDAKKQPFDVSNEYSLMGSFVRSFDLGAVTPTSLYGSATTLSSLFPSAIETALGTRSANALYNQPSTAANGSGGRYDNCKDEDLKTLDDNRGATGDTYCSVVAVSTPDELKLASDQAYDNDNKNIDILADWMLATHDEKEGDDAKSGTFDDDEGCANLDGSEDEDCENSKLASIDKDGTPIKDSQYSKYLKYCTDQREAPWGTQYEPFEQGSDKDQKWYSGDQCMKDTYMMKNFRMWTNYCLQSGTMDGASNCYTQEAAASANTNSTCGDGTTASIYTCAVKFDNYRYQWGGGHGDIADLVKRFNAKEYPEWTQLVDCSGIIRAAAYDAFGVVTDGGATPSVYQNNPHWKAISKEEAQMGDIVSLGTNDAEGHVVIVKSNNPGAKKWDIFHASTSSGPKEDNINHSTLDYAGDGRPVAGIYRFVK